MNRLIEPAEWIFQGKQHAIFSSWHEKAIKLVDLVQAPIKLSRDKLNEFYRLVLNALMGGDTSEIYYFLQKHLDGLIDHGLSFHTIQAALSDLRTLMLDVVVNHPDLDTSSRSYWMSQILELFDTIHNHVQKFYFEKKQHAHSTFNGPSLLEKIPAIFFSLEGGRFSRKGYLSKSFEHWTGIPVKTFLNKYQWDDIIPDQDLKRFRENYHNWKQTLMPFYSFEYTLHSPGKRQTHVFEIGRIDYSPKGEILRVSGFLFEARHHHMPDMAINLKQLLTSRLFEYILFDASGHISQFHLPLLGSLKPKPDRLAKLLSPEAEDQILHIISTQSQQSPLKVSISAPHGKQTGVIFPVGTSGMPEAYLLIFPQETTQYLSTAQRMELLNNFQLNTIKIEDEAVLYQQTIALLKRIFPQAHGGSILVLEQKGFRFRETFNYDLKQLKKIILLDPLKPEIQEKSIQLKAIRASSSVIQIEDIHKQAQSLLSAKNYQLLRKYGRLDEIKSTLSGLVNVDDKPVAILNVDSFTDRDAFTDIDEKLMDLIVQTLTSTLKRIQILNELKKSEANYRQLFERSPVAIYIHQDDRFKLFNPKFLELLDITEQEAREINIWDLVHPDDLPTLKRRAMARLRGEKPLSEYEFRVINKKGEVLNALGSFSSIQFNGKPAILGEVMNITRLKKLERQLQQVQKMETIGRFTAGIAHDFNNILGAIMPGAELIAEDPTNTENKERATIIFNMAKRGAELTQRLLSFARIGMIDKKVLDLKQVILDNQNILLNAVRPSVQLQFKFAEPIPNIEGDPNQLLQMILNLVINANDAIPDKGSITVSLEGKTFKQTRLGTVGIIKPGTHVLLTIKDTGTGIPDEIRDKIFEPFFTTKDPGKGTGLGLSTVYGIIKRHNAALVLHSKPNQGTTFRIYFSATQKKVSQPPKEEASPSTVITNKQKKILLIDDEPQLLDIVKTMLQEMGFSVITASGGKEGLKLFRKHKSQLALIILDFSMPDMTGKEVLEKIANQDQSLPVLIATGYGEEEELAQLKHSGAQHIITKPFTFYQLQKRINEALNHQK